MKSGIKRRAKGGSIRDEEKKEAEDNEEEERARGGALPKRARGGAIPQRKSGGAIGGAGDAASLAKRARGGRLAVHRGMGTGGKFARGGSPWSTAQHTSKPDRGGGHEGEDTPSEVP